MVATRQSLSARPLQDIQIDPLLPGTESYVWAAVYVMDGVATRIDAW